MCKEGNYVRTEYGHCQYCVCEDCAMIYNLYVKPEHRRKGYARHLIQMAIGAVRETGYVKEIKIIADPREDSISRDNLVAFYVKMGLIVKDYDA